MIDFRYHIVSLISVFLALAVGIVLGAGPLRDYIADSLSGQVEQLRQETDELRTELETTQNALGDANEFISAAAPALVDGVLPSYTVSLVLLPGVDSDAVNAVSDTITGAGASVLNIVDIAEGFTDPGKRPFRSGIAGNLSAYLDPEPSDDASAEVVLGTALDQALTSYDPARPQQPSENAAAIMDLLRSSDLVTADGEIQPTLLTVVISSDSSPAEDVSAAELGLIKGMDPARTLVTGIDGEGTLVNVIRADSDASQKFTTTDSLPMTTGQILIPRALAAIISGEHGSYGFAPGVDQVFPPEVEIEAPEPIAPVEDDADEEDGNAEGAADENAAEEADA